MNYKKNNNNKGFSLVELIIVIAIMAILAGAIVPAVIHYIDKARQGRFISDAKNLLIDANADYIEQLAADADNIIHNQPISIGKIDKIHCDMVYVYPQQTVNLATLTVAKNHASFYVDPQVGTLIGCIYNDGRYTGYWTSPDPTGEWTLTKN